jgi:hypothetical protein
MDLPERRAKETIESKIVEKYVTPTLVIKEFAKIELEGWTSKSIPRLLNTVYYCLIKEEGWSFIKEFKNPTIDFGLLLKLCNQKVKEIKSEIF